MDPTIALRVYCIVSFISEIPFIIAVVSLGNSIDQIEKGKSSSLSDILLIVQIVLTVAVIGIITYISRNSYRMLKAKSDSVTGKRTVRQKGREKCRNCVNAKGEANVT